MRVNSSAVSLPSLFASSALNAALSKAASSSWSIAPSPFLSTRLKRICARNGSGRSARGPGGVAWSAAATWIAGAVVVEFTGLSVEAAKVGMAAAALMASAEAAMMRVLGVLRGISNSRLGL